MQSGSGVVGDQLRVQEFLDEVSSLDTCAGHQQWYNVDVAAMLTGCNIKGHSVNHDDGSSILFLDKSVMACHPEKGRVHHYPRGTVHCFVDDFRKNLEAASDLVFAAELFSIAPRDEELCWTIECRSESDIPTAQQEVSRWLSWLND